MRIISCLLSLFTTMAFFACDDGNSIGETVSVYINIDPTEITFNEKPRENSFSKGSTYILQSGGKDLKVYDIYLKSEDPTNPNIDALNAQLLNCDRIKAGLPESIQPNDLTECPVMLYQYNRGSAISRENPMILKAGEVNTIGEEVSVIYRNIPNNQEIPANLQIIIETNVPSSPTNVVNVNITSVPPQMNISTRAIGFREGQMGRENIVIKNIGGEDLIISNVTLNQTSMLPSSGNKEFVVETTSGASLPATIPALGAFSLTVSYNPEDDGIDRGELIIETNDPANPTVTVSMTSEPVLNFLSISANALKFKQAPGLTDVKKVTFSNLGISPINVTNFSFSPENADLSVDRDSFQLTGGQSIDLNISYKPTSGTPMRSTLMIRTDADNAVDGQMKVELFSESQMVNSLSSDKIAVLVPAVAQGESRSTTITLKCDLGTINLSNISFKEGSDPDFSITSGGDVGVLNEGDTRAIEVNFSRATGDNTSRKAVLLVQSDSVAGDIEVSFLANP
jgi:hypothetical protein